MRAWCIGPLWSAIPKSTGPALLLLIVIFGCVIPVDDFHFPGYSAKTRSVFVLNHGWHSGIAFKKRDLSDAVLPETRDFPQADYLEIGWGDREYYEAAEPGVWLALKAALWSKGSVLHVAGIHDSLEHYFPESEIIEVPLSREQFERLTTFVSETFVRSSGAALTRPGLYGVSRFYPANGHFYLFRTCNTWVGEALHAAGLPITPAFAMTAGGLIHQVKSLKAGVLE